MYIFQMDLSENDVMLISICEKKSPKYFLKVPTAVALILAFVSLFMYEIFVILIIVSGDNTDEIFVHVMNNITKKRRSFIYYFNVLFIHRLCKYLNLRDILLKKQRLFLFFKYYNEYHTFDMLFYTLHCCILKFSMNA